VSIWTYEVKRSRRAQRPGGLGWTRRVLCRQVPKASSDSLVPAEYSYFPGESGKHGARLVSSVIDREGSPNSDDVTLDYRPLTCEEWLEATVNKGVLHCYGSVTGRRVRTWTPNAPNTISGGWNGDMAGWTGALATMWSRLYGGGTNGSAPIVLEGPDPSDETGRDFYQVVSGSNQAFSGQTVYEVYSIIDNRDAYFFQFAGKVGCYNNMPMGTFPLAPMASRAGQWLLIGMSCTPRPAAKRIFTMRHRFLLTANPLGMGWAEPCVTQKFRVEVRQLEVLDADGEDTGELASVALPVPVGEGNEVHLIESANFSPIEELLQNSW